MEEIPRRELALPRGFYLTVGVLGAFCVLYALRSVVTPLFLAFAIAYVLDPLIDRFETWGVKRSLAIAIVLVSGVAALSIFVALVLPSVAAEVISVARELPGKVSALLASAEPWLREHGVKLPHTTTEWVERLGANASDVATSMLAPAGGLIGTALSSGLAALGSFVAALVVPVLAIYFLNDFDRIVAGVRELLPRRYRRIVSTYASAIDHTLGHFVRGQLTVMAILGALYGISYAVIGVRLALPIGVVAGVLSFIPYVGSAFALISGLSMSLLGGFDATQLLGVIVAYAVVQALEGFVIAPRIMGKTVGLPEMWVLVALFVGGEVFGFLGVLLAVPAAAVAKIFVSRAVERYQESELYLDGPESIRSIRLEDASQPFIEPPARITKPSEPPSA